ncbi:MAG: alcohol dehydrogenase catalytic domain-containing protein [Deltaproteobacteria bacterium]|nr:alcohol dehydrogenase catalytic domain-containing protein [Deltaproteobacteria bacterium]
MKAAVYYNNKDIRIEDVPMPKIGGGELLVKIEASGVCGSDVMEWYRIKKAPIILGHEIAGTVVEAGAGVRRFKVGDRVTVAHHVPCNTCRHCLKGNHSVCDMLRSTNFDPGGFTEFVRVPAVNVERGVFLLPDNVSFEDGSFSEPLGCVVRAMRACRMEPGKSMLVIGSGMSGLLFIKLGRALGAGLIAATDVSPYRKQAAIAAGADFVFDAKDDVPALVRKGLGGGADIVVLSASRDSAIEQGLKSVERAGTVIFFAPKQPGETYPLPLFDLWRDNVTIVNSYASPPYDTMVAIDLIASGRVVVSDLVTHRLPLAQAGTGFRLAAEAGESMKVIIEPGR